MLEGHNSGVNSLLYIKERDIIVSGSTIETIRLWNLSTYQCVIVIKGVYCSTINSLYQIDKDRVIVGERETFLIVNIDKCVNREDNRIWNITVCWLFSKVKRKYDYLMWKS